MKRVYCFTAFVIVLFLPTFLSAQLPKGVQIPPEKTVLGSPLERGYTLDDCTYTHNFRLGVFNLDLVNNQNYGQSGNSDDLLLPEGYPPMTLRCELNGYIEVVEVGAFSYLPLSDGGYTFVFDHSMTTDLTVNCDESDPSKTDNIIVSMTLIDDNGLPYPLCDYSGQDDIFDCNYFPTSCPIPHCTNEEWVVWEDRVRVDCGKACGIEDPDPDPDPDPESDNNNSSDITRGSIDIQTRDKIDISDPIEVFPNPFYSEFNVQWNSTAENTLIQLYNTSGQLLKSWTNIRNNGEEISELSTVGIPQGVYSLVIHGDGQTSHHRLIKM